MHPQHSEPAQICNELDLVLQPQLGQAMDARTKNDRYLYNTGAIPEEF
jgi:hypothetical protein